MIPTRPKFLKGYQQIRSYYIGLMDGAKAFSLTKERFRIIQKEIIKTEAEDLMKKTAKLWKSNGLWHYKPGKASKVRLYQDSATMCMENPEISSADLMGAEIY